jgi:Ser/Thr protein kinase RdoA (MazF antagonist)
MGPPVSGCPGLLDLLHPRGTVASAGVLGTACPGRLRPARLDSPQGWDLAILAPSPGESASSQWIVGALDRLQTSLARDGIVYLLAGRAARPRLALALERAGLPIVQRMLHLPDAAASELLLPVGRHAMRGAVERLLVPDSPRSRTLRLALAVPGAVPLLGRLHPAVGLVAQRPGGSPLGGWLSAAAGGDAGHRVAAIQTRWRADRVRSVVHLLPGAGGEAAVVKVVLRADEGSAAIQREALALADLGPAARAAGAAVPAGSMIQLTPGCPALLLELLPGLPAARLLALQPERYESLLRRLGEWLEAWSRATFRPQPVDRALLDTWILGPSKRLAGQLEDGDGYVAWLEARGAALVGRSVPLVATHNDLTMANVLMQSEGKLGVVDWEAASAGGLPLRDFFYAAVDATAAREGYRDRPGAFDRCFGGGGGGLPGEILTRLRRAIDLPDDFATLTFHGCWLQHAEDERRKRAPGEALPFLGFVRRAAALRWEI